MSAPMTRVVQMLGLWGAVAGLALGIVFGHEHLVGFVDETATASPTQGVTRATPTEPEIDMASEDHASARPDGPDVVIEALSSGHFITTAEVNGFDIRAMVDTGASAVALTWEDAERAGIFVRPADFTLRVRTANGTAAVAPVTIDRLTIGSITLHDVKATVSERGKLGTTLLGMTFLSRLARFEISSGRLALTQ